MSGIVLVTRIGTSLAFAISLWRWLSGRAGAVSEPRGGLCGANAPSLPPFFLAKKNC